MSDPSSAASSKRVLVVYGTRPEAIKMGPLVAALRQEAGIELTVAVTGQHREMLDEVNGLFGIAPQFDLRLLEHGQTPAQLTERALPRLVEVVRRVRPHAVIVQGDTTTTFTGALAAFYEHVPVVHLEAGLRTGDRQRPFPEEANRRLTTQLTDLHLAPTLHSRRNLEAERVAPKDIVVTGNTVIDALYMTVGRPPSWSDPRVPALLEASTHTVLVTLHRREAWGEPMARVADAVATIARRHPAAGIVLPAHPNAVVREVLVPRLAQLPNVVLTEPLPYGELCHVLNASDLVITDSGGLQEEGPSLGKPVLVARDTTERPEGLASGIVTLVGTERDAIVSAAEGHLSAPRRPAQRPASSPYGDGRASARAAAAVCCLLGLGARLPDFAAPSAREPGF
jgi:UDP-N-acetylglucosamine 2-epimerase (non-hydrolysing)